MTQDVMTGGHAKHQSGHLGADYQGAHIPVLCAEIVEHVLAAPAVAFARDNGRQALGIDATLGRGGHSRALLEADDHIDVFGMDRDPDAHNSPEIQALAAQYPRRFQSAQARFSELGNQEAAHNLSFVCFDLGVSSPQLDQAERGFSFRQDGPLDMRMGREGDTAADLVNSASERDLAKILRDYGEERNAGRIAAAIVRQRQSRPFSRTSELQRLIADCQGGWRSEQIDPATRSFQALRIAVNDELGELRAALKAAAQRLRVGGRLLVISFHSLEDRIVKQFMRDMSSFPAVNRHQPALEDVPTPEFKRIGGLIRPASEDTNPRARSARLRICERQTEPSMQNQGWPAEASAFRACVGG